MFRLVLLEFNPVVLEVFINVATGIDVFSGPGV